MPTGLLLLLILFACLFFRTGEMRDLYNRQLELQTFQLDGGWGYQILINGEIVIYQPAIPAIDTAKPFPSQESACEIGQLVLNRIKFHKDPTVTLDEIKYTLSLREFDVRKE